MIHAPNVFLPLFTALINTISITWEQVRKRKPSAAMIFGDYDHDGTASEFLIQTNTEPCGKRMMMLVGISTANPHLHVFHSVEDPAQPLLLQDREWDALLHAKGPIKVVSLACGDHASETEIELELAADRGNIHVKPTKYGCDADGHRK